MIMERYDTTSMAEAPRFLDADAERGFLSTCRGDDDNSYRVYADGLEAGLTAEHFTDPDMAEYFMALQQADKDNEAGFVGAMARLRNEFPKKEFVKRVLLCCDTSASGHLWIERLVKAHKYRKLQSIAMRVSDSVATASRTDDPADLAASFDSELTELIEPCRSSLLSAEELARVTKERIAEERERGGATLVPHMPWLKGVLDGGFRAGQLIIIAARPSVGKTTLAVNVCYHAAKKDRKSVIYSLEMGADQLGRKLAAIDTGVDLSKFASGVDSKEDRDKLDQGLRNVSALDIWTDDNPAHSITTIRSSAKVLNRRHGLDAVVVDYVGLLRPEDRRMPREQQVAAISRTCKLMAKELDVVVFLVCQLNREVERTRGEPGMHNLRESGAIEQDADVVLLLHRDIGGEDPEEVALIVAKNRFGRSGHSRDRIKFERRCQRFIEKKKTFTDTNANPTRTQGTFPMTEDRI